MTNTEIVLAFIDAWNNNDLTFELAPVTGTVLEVNENLEDSADLINSDPYGDGWLIKIKPTNLNEKDDLMKSAAYKELIG